MEPIEVVFPDIAGEEQTAQKMQSHLTSAQSSALLHVKSKKLNFLPNDKILD